MITLQLKNEDCKVFVKALLNMGLSFELKSKRNFVRVYGTSISLKTEWAYIKGRCSVSSLILSIERERRKVKDHPILDWKKDRIVFFQDLFHRGLEEYSSLPKRDKRLYLGLKSHCRRLWKKYWALYHEPF